MVLVRGIVDLLGGVALVFLGIVSAGAIGYEVFVWAGVPEVWFVNDWPDPRGSALCALLQLVAVLVVCLFAGRILRGRGVNVTWGRMLRAINPVSWWLALLAAMTLWPFRPEGEFFEAWSGVVALVGWAVVIPILLLQARMESPWHQLS